MENRIIKFRAWNSRENKMYYADDVKNEPRFWAIGFHGLPVAIDDDSFKDNEIVGWNIDHFLTLMQFTGLTDKNGKEIYEGDIVTYAVKEQLCKPCADKEIASEISLSSLNTFCPQCGTKTTYEDFISIAEVVYDKAAFGYKKITSEQSYQQWPVFANEFYIEWVEVIGNIHENPELLPR